MATITTRVQGDSPKGSPLTNAEVDNNFINLNDNKLETSGGTLTGNLTISTAGTPQLSLYDTGNAGGGGATHRIEFKNTGGVSTAIVIDSADSTNSDLVITNNHASGYVDDDGIIDSTSDIVLWPLTHVRIASGDLQIGATTVIDASRNISGQLFNVSSRINLTNSSDYGILFGENALGMAYNAQEGGLWAQRYFFMINSTDDDSYPFLTNRTPSGRVSIFSGDTAGGGEVERLVFWGGNGVQDAKFSNANIDLNNNDIKNIDTALFNNGKGLVSDSGASIKTGSGGGTWSAKAGTSTSNGFGVLTSADQDVFVAGQGGGKGSQFFGSVQVDGALTSDTKLQTPYLRLGALNASDVSTGSIDVSIVERATGNGQPVDQTVDAACDLPLAEWFDPYIDLPADETYATATNSWTFTVGTPAGTRWYAKLKLYDAQDGPNDPKLGVNGTEYDLGYERTPNGSAADDSNQWHVYDITDAVVSGTNTVKVWLTGTKSYLVALYVFPSTGVMLPNEPYELPMYSDQGVGIKDTLVIDGSRNITAASVVSEGTMYVNSTDEVFHPGNIGSISGTEVSISYANTDVDGTILTVNQTADDGLRAALWLKNDYDRDVGLKLSNSVAGWEIYVDGGAQGNELVFNTGADQAALILKQGKDAQFNGNVQIGANGNGASDFQTAAGLSQNIATDWIYTNFIEATGERGSGSTGIAISDGSTFTESDEIGFVTQGAVKALVTDSETQIFNRFVVQKSDASIIIRDTDGTPYNQGMAIRNEAVDVNLHSERSYDTGLFFEIAPTADSGVVHTLSNFDHDVFIEKNTYFGGTGKRGLSRIDVAKLTGVTTGDTASSYNTYNTTGMPASVNISTHPVTWPKGAMPSTPHAFISFLGNASGHSSVSRVWFSSVSTTGATIVVADHAGSSTVTLTAFAFSTT
jgi:hypothetical protein